MKNILRRSAEIFFPANKTIVQNEFHFTEKTRRPVLETPLFIKNFTLNGKCSDSKINLKNSFNCSGLLCSSAMKNNIIMISIVLILFHLR